MSAYNIKKFYNLEVQLSYSVDENIFINKVKEIENLKIVFQ